MRVVPFALARQTRHLNVLRNGVRTWLTHYLGEHVLKGREAAVADGVDAAPQAERSGVLHPMAHLVEQEPNSEVPPHFHRPAQFQMFTAGEGALGRHPLRAISVQFAAPFSPYGPVRAGAPGLHYLTLRNGWDPGARFMPQSRPELEATRARVGHTLFADPIDVSPAHELQQRREPASCTVLEAKYGLSVAVHRIPPGDEWRAADPAAGQGQFQIITAGAAVARDGTGAVQELEPMSCIFVEPADAANTMQASEQGLELVVMQFPREDYFIDRAARR